MDLLEKVEKALSELEESKELETPVVLSFSELRGIRREILMAEYGAQLSAENLKAGKAIGESRKARGTKC